MDTISMMKNNNNSEVRKRETLEEMRLLSDEELLRRYDVIQGRTNEYQSYFNADYSYTSLTQEIKNRGYIQGWLKPSDNSKIKTIRVDASDKNERFSLNMTASCKKKYSKFLEGKENAAIHTSAALELYMDLKKKNQIKVIAEY